jgi:hypothetical protein
MKILGDPAWLQQGEVSTGVNAQTFNYKPFNPDGTINYDSQQVTFTVSFNRPTDYNFSTGIMNTNSASGAPKETFAYIATECRSVFSKGQFTQELTGSLLPLGSNPGPAGTADARPTASTATTATGSRASGYQNEDQQNADGNGASVPNGYQNENQQAADGNGPPTPQPASPPSAPTSSGDVAPADTTAPQNANTTDKVLANEEETAAVNAYIAAGGTFPRGTGPITSGPLFDNVVAAKASLTARQQATAGSATSSAPPQQIAKDDN